MLAVASTIPAYQKLAEIPPADRVRAWQQVYEAAYPGIFACYYAGYGHGSGRGEAAAHVPELAPQLEVRQARIRAALERADVDAADYGLIAGDATINVVLLVGTRASDAWVDVFHGQPTLFVALEMLDDPDNDELLVMHEVIHIAHYHALWQVLASQSDLRNEVGFRVWAEGLAVAGTRRLRPGYPDSSYLSAPYQDWINECHDRLPAIAGALLPSLSTADPRLTYRLCGMSEDQPWPSRAGYWIGDAIACELLDEGHTLSQLLSWEPAHVVHAMCCSALLAPFNRSAARSEETSRG